MHAKLGEVKVQTSKALNETKNINARLLTVEEGGQQDHAKMERLEDTVKKLQAKLAAVTKPRASLRGSDDSETRKSVLFRGFNDETAEKRVEMLETYMKTHFPSVKFACVSHETTGSVQNKKLANSSFVLFFDQLTAENILKQIEKDSSKYKCVNVKGDSLKICKRKTKLERKRNYGLARAEEILTEQLLKRKLSAEAKIVWDKRAVTVNSAEAFKQNREDEIGSFCGVFPVVVFSDRK